MKEFFDYLRTQILSWTDMDEPIQTVEIWRNQIQALEVERTERTYPHPACFIELKVEDVKNYADGIQDYTMRVIFHFAFEHYIHEHTESLIFTEQFHQRMHRLTRRSAEPYFSSMEETPLDLDENTTNVDHPYRVYRTCLRITTAHAPLQEFVVGDLDVQKSIDTGIFDYIFDETFQ